MLFLGSAPVPRNTEGSKGTTMSPSRSRDSSCRVGQAPSGPVMLQIDICPFFCRGGPTVHFCSWDGVSESRVGISPTRPKKEWSDQGQYVTLGRLAHSSAVSAFTFTLRPAPTVLKGGQEARSQLRA